LDTFPDNKWIGKEEQKNNYSSEKQFISMAGKGIRES
jgi:hypothetical protein